MKGQDEVQSPWRQLLAHAGRGGLKAIRDRLKQGALELKGLGEGGRAGYG